MIWKSKVFLKEFNEKGHGLFCGNFGTYPVSKMSGIIIKNQDDLKLADLLMRQNNSASQKYIVQYDDIVREH